MKGHKDQHTHEHGHANTCLRLLFIKRNRYLYKITKRKDTEMAWYGIWVLVVSPPGSDVQPERKRLSALEVSLEHKQY